MNDLFTKGDIIEYNEIDDPSYDYPFSYRIRNEKYQIGNKISRKKKLLELNSPITTEVELYNNKGVITLIGYDKLQDLLKSSRYKITGREKKKIKL